VTEKQSIEMLELISFPRILMARHIRATHKLGDVSEKESSSGGKKKDATSQLGRAFPLVSLA